MPHFNDDRAQAIERAFSSGIGAVINVGIDIASTKAAIKLAESHPGIYAAAGFHPHNVTGIKYADIDQIAQLAGHPRVVAIGEVGLDFHRDYSPREAQLWAFRRQLEMAAELSLPVVIHCREAEAELIPIVKDWALSLKGNPVGVIHCFNGDAAAAQTYLDMGFYISLGAYIGYPKSRGLHDVIKSVPQDRLLVETDCPYLPPQSRRGKRNEPAYLPLTVTEIAGIRGVSRDVIAAETTENACRLFRLELQPGG